MKFIQIAQMLAVLLALLGVNAIAAFRRTRRTGRIFSGLAAAMGLPVMTADDMEAYVPQLSTQDVIWQPLFDSANYGTAGQQQLQFYTVPQGQGVSTSPSAATTTTPKSIQDTNLQSAGQLTLGQAFLAVAQEVLFFPGENPNEGAAGAPTTWGKFLNDTYAFSKDGTLTLAIGSNRYYIQDGPLGLFPPSVGLAVAAAVAGVPTTTGNVIISDYAVMSGAPYLLVPIYLQANLQFSETLSWGSATALPSANAARVFVRMRGYLNRNAQ